MPRRLVIVALVIIGCATSAPAPRSLAPRRAHPAGLGRGPFAATQRGGVIEATVTDTESGALVKGSTVVVTSRALQPPRALLTDENGSCTFADLPDGVYIVTAYYEDLTMTRCCLHIDGATGARIPFTLAEGKTGETVHG